MLFQGRNFKYFDFFFVLIKCNTTFCQYQHFNRRIFVQAVKLSQKQSRHLSPTKAQQKSMTTVPFFFGLQQKFIFGSIWIVVLRIVFKSVGIALLFWCSFDVEDYELTIGKFLQRRILQFHSIMHSLIVLKDTKTAKLWPLSQIFPLQKFKST